MSHWIIAPVVVPALIGALIVILLRGELVLQRVASVAGIVVLNAIAVELLWSATIWGPEAYFLGDWPAPFGITLVLDRLSAMMVLLLTVLALPAIVYAIGSGWDAKGAHFHALVQFLLMGIAGAFLTGDAFNLFVFFEVLLIASYGLMIHGGGERRTRAGIQYIGFNLLASSLFLVALATVYAVAGTLNLADLARKLPNLPEGDAALIRVAAMLLILVFAVKGALVPLQFWLPGTYAQAPGVVAALFAIMTKVGAYATLRFGTLVFPTTLPATGTMLADVLMPAAVVTLAVGAIGILGASTLPRLVAFSAIASMGTAFIAIAGFTPALTAAALYYVIHSTLATALMFLVADMVTRRRSHARLDAPEPPIASEGIIAAFFMAGAIALAGMPPLSGFVGKLLILDASRADAPVIWTAILVSSFLMILGFARAGSLLFWKSHADDDAPFVGRREPLTHLAIFAVGAALVAITVLAGPVTDWLNITAAGLYDPEPYITANQLDEER